MLMPARCTGVSHNRVCDPNVIPCAATPAIMQTQVARRGLLLLSLNHRQRTPAAAEAYTNRYAVFIFHHWHSSCVYCAAFDLGASATDREPRESALEVAVQYRYSAVRPEPYTLEQFGAATEHPSVVVIICLLEAVT